MPPRAYQATLKAVRGHVSVSVKTQTPICYLAQDFDALMLRTLLLLSSCYLAQDFDTDPLWRLNNPLMPYIIEQKLNSGQWST